MMMLKECPFCGSKKVKAESGILSPLSMVVCRECGAIVSFIGRESVKGTIDAWNKRPGTRFS